MQNIIITSFNNGEVTSKVDARSDVEKYTNSCRILENMLPTIYGCATRRPGTEYIYTAKKSPLGVRLIPFIYSSEIAYECEFGDLYVRFYYDGEILTDGGIPVEVTSPYLVADLPQLQYNQIGDVMWLVHPDYPQYKLKRTTVTSFILEEIEFEKGPFLIRNDIDKEDGVTMASNVTAVDATGTLTASLARFFSGHVGSLWKLVHKRAVTSLDIAVTTTGASSSIGVKGIFTCNTTGRWAGTLVLERSEDGITWDAFRTFTNKEEGVANWSSAPAGGETADDILYRFNVTTYTSGTISAVLTVNNPTKDGIVRIDSITSPTVANITVLAEVEEVTATLRWAEGAWSDYRGYPRAVTFFQDRIIYGGTANDPQTIWWSSTDDFEDFEEGVNDDDSFSRMLTTTNDILWIEGLEGIVVGTSGDERAVRSNKLDTPVTPTTAVAAQQSNYGSAPIQAIRVRNAVLFVDPVRRKVREMTYTGLSDDKYVSPDLAAFAEHITEGGITCMAYQKHPDSILWSIRGDGVLLSMTYEREQNVIAWARHLVGLMQVDTTETSYWSNPVSNYKMTYISENGNVWGVPINFSAYTTLCLDVGGVARNAGGGKVGLPCVGHPFKSGQVIRVSGSTNYDDVHTLTSGTSEDELIFSATYFAETFDGTETVVQYTSISASTGRMDQDIDGNLYFGHIAGVTKISGGLTQNEDFFDPTGGWTAGKVTLGTKISFNSDYLYVYTEEKKLYKFDLSDGSEIWQVSTGGAVGYDIAVDSDDNVYVCNAGDSNNCAVFASSDGAKTSLGESEGVYAICVDNNMSYTSGKKGVVITGGFAYGDDPTILYNLAIRNLDDTSGKAIALGGTYHNFTYETYIVRTGCIVTYNNYIYVLVEGIVYKLNSQLEIIAWVAAPTYACGLFVDFRNQIVVVNQDYTDHQTDIFWFYDENLNYLSKIGGFYNGMLMTWTQAVGGAYTQGNACFYPGVVPHITNTVTTRTTSGIVESVSVIPGETEDEVWLSVRRTINGEEVCYIERMRPRAFDSQADAFFVDCGFLYDGDPTDTFADLDFLEGEEVTILGDGAVFPNQTVADGQIVLSESVSKAAIGLPFQYKLKPMRLDIGGPGGTSKGSYMKISEMVISFFETLNAKYGTSIPDKYGTLTDTLYNIEWRTSEAFDEPPALFTGDKTVVLDGGFDPEDPILISGSDPLPCTVRAIVVRVEKVGR